MKFSIKKNDTSTFEATVSGTAFSVSQGTFEFESLPWEGVILVQHAQPRAGDPSDFRDRIYFWISVHHETPPPSHSELLNPTPLKRQASFDASSHSGRHTVRGKVAVKHDGHWDVLRWSLDVTVVRDNIFDRLIEYTLTATAKHEGTLPAGTTVQASSGSSQGSQSQVSAITEFRRFIRQQSGQSTVSLSGTQLAARLVDSRGRIVGYSTLDGRLLSMATLVRLARQQGSGSDLEVVKHRGREYLRMAANAATSDNLSALPRLRVNRQDLE